MFIYGIHLLVVVSWAIFLLQFIKSLQNNTSDKFIFGILSLISIILVLYFGVKLMLLNPQIAKSGGWLHLKLTFVTILILQNFYFFYTILKKKTISKKFLEVVYWFDYIAFMFMIYLTMFRPF